MATVRMADYLRRDIVRKFEQLYDKSNPQIEHSTHVGDKMYDIFLGGKVLQFKEQISNIFGDIIDPDSMFIKSSTLPVSINMMVYDDIREYNDLEDKYITQVKEQFEDGRRIDLPLSVESLQMNDINSWRGEEAIVVSLDSNDIPEHAQMYIDKVKEIEQKETKRLAKRRADSEKVERALENFTTLNQALKAWPALTKLVSSEKIAKVHEKQQRKRKEKQQRSKIEPIESNLNQTILTASLLGDD